MKTFFATRVSSLSWLPTAGRQTSAVKPHHRHHQQSFPVQIGVSDKCATGSPSDLANSTISPISSRTVTYLRFSHNFTRLDVALKKSHPQWSTGGITALGLLCTSSLCSHSATKLAFLTDSLRCYSIDSLICWPLCTADPSLAIAATTSSSNRNHRSSTLGGHLGVHLSANKLTGKFVCSTATDNIHWYRIGAIKATTSTTRDTRNNKWTSVGEGTRPQDQQQVPSLAVSRHASRHWQQSASESAVLALRSRLTRCNAFNKLMTTSGRMALFNSSHPPMIQHSTSRTIHSIATSRSAVSSEVICKRHRLIERAQLWPQCSSLWTSMPRHDSEDGPSKRCWRCDKPINSSKTSTVAEAKVAVCQKCGSIQPISSDVNFFGLFNLDSSFDIDSAQLRQHYLRLQQNMHPDMNVNRSNTETGYSLDNSSIINSAYKTLRDPYQRALYLLKMRYNMSIDEGNIETEPELLLEIMELNEDIELADDKASLMDVSGKIEHNIAQIVDQLKTAFSEDNAAEARKLVVRYAYYNSALDKLRGQLVSVHK